MSRNRNIYEDDDVMRNLGDDEEYNQQVEDEELNEEPEEDEEEEDEDDQENDYVNDGFVVGDSDEDENEEEEDEDAAEKQRRKRERRMRKKLEKQNPHKRVLKKVNRMVEEEDEDENVIGDEELEDYHEGSEGETIPKKKQKPQRNQDDYDDQLDEDLGMDDNENEDGGYANKMGRHSSAFQDLFIDEDESGQEMENEDEEEKSKADEEEDINFHEFFEPDDIKNRYERDDDKKIKEEDVPERLQLRMFGRKIPDAQELLEETKWIYEKLRTSKDYKDSKKLSDNNYHKKIFQFLEALHADKEEVMYIYTYKKNDFHPLFDLDDLWRLYDLDGEWATFNRYKYRILLQIQQIRQEIDNAPILITNNIIDSEQLKRVEEFYHKAIDVQSLKFVKEYFDYLFIKIYPQKDHSKLKIRKDRKSRMINTYIQCNVHQSVHMVSLAPYDLVKNLEEMNSNQQPQVQMNKPQAYAENLIRMNPNVGCMKKALDALECMVDYQSNELYYYPPLKKWFYEMYKQKCYISTEPTELGKKQIDMFHPLYPAKRIYKRPFSYFTEDTWLLIEEAERLNLVTVKIFLKNTTESSSDKSDELVELINRYYCVSLKTLEQPLRQINMEWNIFRKYNIELVCDKFFIPHVQSLLRTELHENSEKWVIQQCQQKFYNMINVEPQKNGSSLHRIMSVVQDSNGKIGVVFVDEYGIPKDSIILNYFTKNEKQLITKLREEKRLEEQLLDSKKEQFKPSVAVVAANSIQSQGLKNILHNKCFSQYGDDTIPQIVAKQPVVQSSSVLPPYKDSVLRVALSQARMILNPTAEILSLWNERTQQNGCLNIPLHPSKEYISLDKLQYALEKCCVQIVNLMGVEIDMLQDQPHLKHLLQHVCGLGPRKAMKMIELLDKNPVIFQKNDDLKKREILFTHLDVKTVVFKNINGFIKFKFSKDPLEKTRINKELYKISKKICKESADSFQGKLQTDEEFVEYVMNNPKSIEAIDLEDYAQQLDSKKGQQNMAPVLDFIKDELINPFSYKKNPFESISDQDLFFKMIKESPQTFRKGMIVTAKIMQIKQKETQHKSHQLLVKIIDNDLKSSILVKEDEVKNFRQGDIIKAYIDQIFVIDSRRLKEQMISFDVNCVTLTFHEKEFDKLIRETHKCFEEKSIYETFRFVPNEDKPLGIDVTARKAKKFEPRKIAHPNFKNISISDAVKLLKNQKNGEFIIRPSSKGKNYLAITWKFFDDVFVHLSLKEEISHTEKSFQTKFILNEKESFDNFDEIIERYIIPCNNHMNVVKDHRKFSKSNIEDIEKELKKNKDENPDIIHYQFCCIPKYPQFIVLLYCSRQDTVTKEWIKVKYQGFYFHDQYFGQFKDLIMWFKNNFHTPEYKKYVKKAEEPYAPKAPYIPGVGISSGIKQEGGAKYEKSEGRGGGQKCQNCGKYGHAANNCKNKRSYPSSGSGGAGTGSGPKQCFHCKGTDHFIKDCPTRSQQTQRTYSGSSRRDRNQSRSRSRSYEKDY